MTPQTISISQLTLYNPARMKDAEIVAAFVVRKAVYERICAEIAAEPPTSRAQHHLIIGQRGMGKSMLLARLAAELRSNADLSRRFVPLVFAEEQYAVDRLSKFWLNCLDSMADAAERIGDTNTSARIDAIVRSLKQSDGASEKDDAPAKAAVDAFLREAIALGRRPILLVDNLQIVFERISRNQQHALREVLMRPGCPIFIAASPSPPPETQDYSAPFYDHFKTHYLRPLSVDDMCELMLKLAETTSRKDVSQKVLAHPERLQVLRDLTGGNPRTVVTLFFLYAENFSPSVFSDLENLLDRVTPLYKARIEELSEQQQVVVSAVADHWKPLTARTLAKTTGLQTGTVAAQLDRLEKIGFVEKVDLFDETSTGYQIAERFFNVWFLMRSASRRQRREVEFLVRFIETFYEAKERLPLAERLQKECDFSADHHLFAKALAHTLNAHDGDDLRRHFELDALRQKAVDARRKLEDVIDFSKLPPSAIAFDRLRERLMAIVPPDATVKPDHFAEIILGDRQMFLRGEPEKLAERNATLTNEEIGVLLQASAEADNLDESKYSEPAVAWFRRRLAGGQLTALENIEDWRRAFRQADDQKICQLMVDSIPDLLGAQLGEECWEMIRSAMATSADWQAWQWYNWGYSLSYKLSRRGEAETAYRRAIDLDPNFADPWNELGNLLQRHLGRYEEAEAAYRRAAEIDPKYAPPWNGLGNLLQGHLGRYAEAEAAYRRAAEIDPKYAPPWNGLGNLLQDHLGRYEEAETAYRRAIEINPKNSYALNGLGFVLHYHLGRYAEAEAAYRRATEINPKYTSPLNGLGNLMCDHYQKYEEAASAFSKAIQIDPADTVANGNLVFLYRDFLADSKAARHTFARLQLTREHGAGDSYFLHESLFAAYDANWGLCSEAISKALEVIGGRFPPSTADDWFRASAVFLHLNYGEHLLAFLRQRGDDAKLRPWYEALAALHNGDRRYLQNIAVEVRTTAEYYFDQIEQRLNVLPEKTRRRPPRRPIKKRRQ